MPAARVGAGWLGRASGRLPDLLIQILLVELGQVLIAKGLFVAAGPCPSADLFNRIFSREPLPPRHRRLVENAHPAKTKLIISALLALSLSLRGHRKTLSRYRKAVR